MPGNEGTAGAAGGSNGGAAGAGGAPASGGVGTGSNLAGGAGAGAAGGGTPPPAAGTGGAPAAGAGAGGAATGGTDWTSTLNDDSKAFIANKQFKGPADLLDSYRNLEKLVGAADKVVKIPDSMDSPEGRAFMERLGAPKEAKDYNLAFAPENNTDPKFVESLGAAFHEAGVPKTAAEKIVAKISAYQADAKKAALDAYQSKFKDAEATLKKDWGAAEQQNRNIAAEAMRTMGFTTKEVDSISFTLGHDRTMKLLHKLGVSVGEASFHAGRGESGVLEPANAMAQQKALMQDAEFRTKLLAGDVEASRKWENLGKQAAPGEISF